MSLSKELETRSNGACELCGSTENVNGFAVEATNEEIAACTTCVSQIEDADLVEPNHWRCLNDSMWSTVPAVQVMAWRMLTRLRAEGWPQDLLDMLYLDEETLELAKATGEGEEVGDKIIIFPAWPKSWNVKFKLHCSRGTIVEAEMKQGKAHVISVYPKKPHQGHNCTMMRFGCN